MGSRRQAREFALQALFQCDSLDEWSTEQIELYFEHFQSDNDHPKSSLREQHSFSYELCFGVIANLPDIDAAITAASQNWSLGRMSRVDRNILRIGTYEIFYLDDVPPNVSINEGIEVAKRYGSDDSPLFINGVLDRIAVESMKAQPKKALKAVRA